MFQDGSLQVVSLKTPVNSFTALERCKMTYFLPSPVQVLVNISNCKVCTMLQVKISQVNWRHVWISLQNEQTTRQHLRSMQIHQKGTLNTLKHLWKYLSSHLQHSNLLKISKSQAKKSPIRKRRKKVSLNTQQWTKHLSKSDNKMFYTHFRNDDEAHDTN